MLNETYYVYRPLFDESIVGTGPETLTGKRIGVVDGSNSERNFTSWLKRKGCAPVVSSYSDAAEMKAAFASGAIDGFVSSDNVAYSFEGSTPAMIVGREPYYLAVAPGQDSLLTTLNDVQSIMYSQDRAFLNELQIRFAADSSASAYLTAAEIEWMETHSSLTVGYLSDYLPYCDTDANDEPTGLMVDVLFATLDSLPASWDPDITFQGFADQGDLFAALKAGDIDVAFPVGGETWYAESNGFLRSSAVASPAMDLVYKAGAEFDVATKTIAVNRHNLLQQNYTATYFPDAEVVECDSIDECLAAVKEGRAGCTVVNGLRASALLTAETELMSAQLPASDDRCFGVMEGNGVLLQILNRGLGIIGENYGMNASYRYTDGLFTYSVFDFMRDNWQVLVAIAAALIAVAVFCVALRFRKIHREKQREEEQNRRLEEALEQAERASRAKDVLLGNLSHDIRTPLNGILGVMDVNASCSDEAAVKENITKARAAARQLLCLVDDLLEMGKLKSGDVEITPEPFVIADVMTDVLSGVKPQAKEAGVSIVCGEFPESGCEGAATCQAIERIAQVRVVGSPTYLRQVLANVFDNAVRYNKSGGRVVWDASLDLPEKGDETWFTCVVSDTGKGMDLEARSHLFEPFYQGEASARSIYPGSGLGMSIASSLVELMGGEIEVQSAPGEGTTVTLRVPFDLVDRSCALPTADAPQSIEGERILLVEDNDLNLEITQYVLEREGAVVVLARNGEQAVEAFKASPVASIDAVVMDVMMPVMDGYEATRAIRALDRPDAATVPIVAITANVFEDDRARAFEAGMNEHLPKPLDPDCLVAVLAKLRA